MSENITPTGYKEPTIEDTAAKATKQIENDYADGVWWHDSVNESVNSAFLTMLQSGVSLIDAQKVVADIVLAMRNEYGD